MDLYCKYKIDNAGKSTFLASLKGHADFKPMPTVGFNREVLKHEHYEITYFDVGGGANIRAIWPNYFPSVSLISLMMI